MIHVELGRAEAQMLQQILTSYLGDLRMEIAATDRKIYRDALHLEEDFIKALCLRLEEQTLVNDSLEIPGML